MRILVEHDSTHNTIERTLNFILHASSVGGWHDVIDVYFKGFYVAIDRWWWWWKGGEDRHRWPANDLEELVQVWGNEGMDVGDSSEGGRREQSLDTEEQKEWQDMPVDCM